MFNIETLRSKSVTDLTKILKDLGVKVARNSNENDKIFAILDFQASNPKVAKDYFNATESSITTEEPPVEKTVKAPAKKLLLKELLPNLKRKQNRRLKKRWKKKRLLQKNHL